MAEQRWTFLGIDFGKERDFTATVVVDRVGHTHDNQRVGTVYPPPRLPPATYTVRHLRRFPLGTDYTTVIDIATLCRSSCLHPATTPRASSRG